MTQGARVVLCSEFWGSQEGKFAHPLVGASGREAARMMATAGLTPELAVRNPDEKAMIRHWARCKSEVGLHITNVFNEPAGSIDAFFDTTGNRDLPALRPGKYVLPRHMHHVLRFWDELKSLSPNLVISCGNAGAWATLGKTGISNIRGAIHRSKRLGLKVLPTYNPAAVIHQWSLRPIQIADFIKAKDEAEFPEIRRIERWITINPTLDEIAEWITRPADSYAADIETLAKQITMISFARNPHDILVVPFWSEEALNLISDKKPIPPGLNPNYWTNPADEVQAWKYVNQLLSSSVPKTGQNFLYDLQYLLRMGMRLQGVGNDTMLRHHSYYPELPKALGFLGSLYSKEIAWKSMSKSTETLKRDD